MALINQKEVKSIILLNPPGDHKYLRDYYCSTVSKAGYYWHPVDLLIQSGYFRDGYRLRFLDAIAENLSASRCWDELREFRPDAVLFLTGAQSWKKDFEFIRKIKESLAAITIGTGEIFLGESRKIIEDHDFLDGAILKFINSDLRNYFEHRFDLIEDMAYREGTEVAIKRSGRDGQGDYRIPVPAHEMFLSKNYYMPFMGSQMFATVLADYGCPHRCAYCNSGSLPYQKRDLTNVLDELSALRKMGVSRIFFKDMTFTADQEKVLSLCERINGADFQIKWNCYSRPDLTDEDMVKAMKKAGCFLIQFGIENPDPGFLAGCNRRDHREDVIRSFELCRKYKILTGAHFILGLPGEPKIIADDYGKYIKMLKPDYLSINIYSHRIGSESPEQTKCPDGEIMEKRKHIYRKYYFRPKYIWKTLIRAWNHRELVRLLSMGLYLWFRKSGQ